MRMEVRLELDEREIEEARRLAGITDPAQLVRFVLREFVQLRVRQQIQSFEGSDPQASPPPRRMPPDLRDPDER